MRIAILLLLTAVFAAPAAAFSLDGDSAASSESIYAYSESDMPQVFFFPKEQARWDGTQITMKEWYLLTPLQKQKFISEYIGELEAQYQQTINVMGLDYLEALNAFSYYSDSGARSEPSVTFIDKLLIGQGKMPRATDDIMSLGKSE